MCYEHTVENNLILLYLFVKFKNENNANKCVSNFVTIIYFVYLQFKLIFASVSGFVI